MAPKRSGFLMSLRPGSPLRAVSWWTITSGSVSATAPATASGSSASATTGRAPKARSMSVVAGGGELRDELGADRPGSSGDEHLHGFLLPIRLRADTSRDKIPLPPVTQGLPFEQLGPTRHHPRSNAKHQISPYPLRFLACVLSRWPAGRPSAEVGGRGGGLGRSGGLGGGGSLLPGFLGGLLERREADSGAGGPALGPAWGAPGGFRRGGRRPKHAQQARKKPADTVGRQLPGRAGPLPRQPLIGDELAGQSQLGVGGDHQPGPPLRLLGVAHPRGGPAEGLFTEPDGVLAVEPAGVGPPGKVEIAAAGSGPPQPQHLGRARAGGDAFDLHADDGPAHDRARPAGAVAGVAVLLGMQSGPRLHGHGAVLVVVGHVGGGRGGPGGRVGKGELGAVAARAAASAGWAWWWVGVEAAV